MRRKEYKPSGKCEVKTSPSVLDPGTMNTSSIRSGVSFTLVRRSISFGVINGYTTKVHQLSSMFPMDLLTETDIAKLKALAGMYAKFVRTHEVAPKAPFTSRINISVMNVKRGVCLNSCMNNLNTASIYKLSLKVFI
ncbi:unnamed protein product [Lepeophtheirus salmonis]|uniref:(salmon louse) hypothetical protein n=1 Tax=Lepeophtheirus salmonis TaxID=72036 RepID=A0A7R8H0I3_LEPSM|nr:unnamed protein product [Lepeophtheirus salmonis]CAF2790337.1 unnamed protein product [Lepeophtheirus salmonis]